MTRKADILTLSKFILLNSIINGASINHYKLQKMLYYIQAYHLVYFDKQLIFDELPEAWVNGPVYRSVWNALKEKGNVKAPFSVISTISPEEEFEKTKKYIELSDEQWKFLESLLTQLNALTDEKLIFMTHSEAPWNLARKNVKPFEYSENKITDTMMFDYYSERLKKRREKQNA